MLRFLKKREKFQIGYVIIIITTAEAIVITVTITVTITITIARTITVITPFAVHYQKIYHH